MRPTVFELLISRKPRFKYFISTPSIYFLKNMLPNTRAQNDLITMYLTCITLLSHLGGEASASDESSDVMPNRISSRTSYVCSDLLLPTDGIVQHDSHYIPLALQEKHIFPAQLELGPLGHHFAPHLARLKGASLRFSRTSSCFSLAFSPAAVRAVAPDF